MSTKRISAIPTVLSVFLFTSLAAPDVQAATYSFTTFDVPDAITFFLANINTNGQVTGSYWDNSAKSHGFLYSNGTFTTFDVPGAVSTVVTSINASGSVTGYYYDNSNSHGFLYSSSTFTTLDVPGTDGGAMPTSINDRGQVTGNYNGNLSFLYSSGTFTTLTPPGATYTHAASINASGQVAGHYTSSTDYRIYGFVYGGGIFTTLDIPGAAGGIYPNSINLSGQVTGRYCTSVGGGRGVSPPVGCHGFLYNSGTFATLNVLGATETYAESINTSGQVTGSYSDSSLRRHGFVYSNGTFTTLDVPGATGTEAVSINDSGQVTGYYLDGSGSHGFIATPVCVTPTVAIHTLTTAPNGWFRITGSITLDSIPLCALVLANGQLMFTCGDSFPKGDFDLTVPPDAHGQITLFGFSAGLLPFQQTFSPSISP